MSVDWLAVTAVVPRADAVRTRSRPAARSCRPRRSRSRMAHWSCRRGRPSGAPGRRTTGASVRDLVERPCRLDISVERDGDDLDAGRCELTAAPATRAVEAASSPRVAGSAHADASRRRRRPHPELDVGGAGHRGHRGRGARPRLRHQPARPGRPHVRDRRAPGRTTLFVKLAPLDPVAPGDDRRHRHGRARGAVLRRRRAHRRPAGPPLVLRRERRRTASSCCSRTSVPAGCGFASNGEWGMPADAAAVALEQLAVFHARFEDADRARPRRAVARHADARA